VLIAQALWARAVGERPWRIRQQRAAKHQQKRSLAENQVYGGSEAAAIRAMNALQSGAT